MFVCLFIYSKLFFFKHCVRFFSGSPRKSHNEYKSFFLREMEKARKNKFTAERVFKEKKNVEKFRWINQNFFFVRSFLFFLYYIIIIIIVEIFFFSKEFSYLYVWFFFWCCSSIWYPTFFSFFFALLKRMIVLDNSFTSHIKYWIFLKKRNFPEYFPFHNNAIWMKHLESICSSSTIVVAIVSHGNSNFPESWMKINNNNKKKLLHSSHDGKKSDAKKIPMQT